MEDKREGEMGLIAYRLDQISKKVDSITDAIRGNGKPGILLEIERLHASVKQCEQSIELVKTQREADRLEIAKIKNSMQDREMEDAKFRSRLKGVVIGATFAGVGGGGGLVLFLQQLFGG